MSDEILILMATAASIGFFHTLFGPDHYLPFIVMSKSGKWSIKKTAFVTFLCGIGHVLGSVLLGLLGVALGVALARLELIESVRGELAAWFLIAFGLVYFVWGVRRAIRNKPHHHAHVHGDGTMHEHEHVHASEHIHVHTKKNEKNLTPWVLFTIFVLGPCEPLIPILMFPAAKEDMFGLFMVTAVFGIVTIVTMLTVVLIASYGVSLLPTEKLERYIHAIAGATISLSGMAIQFLGL
jgi:nickel/cobalt exporter